MKSNITVVWFRNDLRTDDHRSLSEATQQGQPVIGVYCFDPSMFEKDRFGFKKTAKFRAKFLVETIQMLRTNLLKLNIPLFVYVKTPERSFEEISEAYQITQVYYQKEWTQEEQDIETALKANSRLQQIRWNSYYDQFLIHPEDLPFSIQQLPSTFTGFRKKVERQWVVRKKYTPVRISPSIAIKEHHTKLPTLEGLGFPKFEIDPRSAFPFLGGEDNANTRMRNYFWENRQLSHYKKTRNGLIGVNYSTKLSPWLSNGSISPRMIYQQVMHYENTIEKNDSTYWLVFELLWRDYFKLTSLKYGNKIFWQSGIQHRSYQWDSDPRKVEAWILGATEENFVNANMIELKTTGWMSNRGRQNVASYFAKTLKADWRIGAAYFQSMLIDYDVHSNFGNWMYVAGVGNDPRDRTFNVSLQAKRYDPNKEFQELWGL